MRELVSSLHFYQNQPGSLGIGEITITGGTAQLPGLAAELQRLIGVTVRVGDPFTRVDGSRARLDARRARLRSQSPSDSESRGAWPCVPPIFCPPISARAATGRLPPEAIAASAPASPSARCSSARNRQEHGTVTTPRAGLAAVEAQILQCRRRHRPARDDAPELADRQGCAHGGRRPRRSTGGPRGTLSSASCRSSFRRRLADQTLSAEGRRSVDGPVDPFAPHQR